MKDLCMSKPHKLKMLFSKCQMESKEKKLPILNLRVISNKHYFVILSIKGILIIFENVLKTIISFKKQKYLLCKCFS